MELLEREHFFHELEGLLGVVAAGNGRLVLVGGEAGIGKTSLIERFAETPKSRARVLWGACDALLTVSPVAVHCEPLPITIPAGTPVVPLNQFDTNLRYFVVGEGLGTTQFCAVTSSPNVGTTVCSTSPF
jgi:predicted ATPase